MTRRHCSPHDGPAHGEAAGESGVVIPLRSFRFGKARLAAMLDDDDRSALAQRMAEAVVAAAGSRPLAVVSSAPEVDAWCRARGLTRIDDPGSLDTAADAGRAWARKQGLARVIVVHGDLPFAVSLDEVDGDGSTRVAVLVADHRGDGTPVCSVPVDAPFGFAYGPDSYARHVAAAAEAGLRVREVHDHALSFDVDVPEDLEQLDVKPTC